MTEGRHSADAGPDAVQSEVWRRLRSLVDAIREEALAQAGSIGVCQPTERIVTEAAKALYSARRRRARHFSDLSAMFEEPAWDILLDLFISERENRDVSVSSACLAAFVPPTTALRWVGVLEQHGALQREPDPCDRRRINLRLTDQTRSAMYDYIIEVVIGRTG